MDQHEITNIVDRIGDFIHEWNNLISRRTEAVRHYLGHLQKDATNKPKKHGKVPLIEWIGILQDANTPNEVNNHADTQLDSGIDPKENNHDHQSDEAKIVEEEKKQMQMNIELARFLGLATLPGKPNGNTKNTQRRSQMTI